MKLRFISIAIAAAGLIALSGCGEEKNDVPDGMTETFYSAGVKFVGVIDQAIDMEIDAEEAAEKASVYAEVLEEEIETSEMEEAMKSADVDIETKRLILNTTVINAKLICEDLKYYDWEGEVDLSELIESRNDFADDFGIENRSL